MGTLTAKKAYLYLRVASLLTIISLGGTLFLPRRIKTPSRSDFPSPGRLFSGAVALKASSVQQPNAKKAEIGREITRGQAIQLGARLKDGRVIMITELPIRVRSFNNFELQRIKQLLSLRTDIEDGVKMDRRGVYRTGADEILITRSKKGVLAETCITYDAIGHTTQNGLTNTVRKKSLSFIQRLESIIGLRQPREWQCLYVAAIIPLPAKYILDATSAWRELRQIRFKTHRS